MVSLSLGWALCRLFSGSQVWDAVQQGASLKSLSGDHCWIGALVLSARNTFPSVLSIAYPFPIIIIIIITLFIWTHKSMFAVLLFSRKGKKPNGWWLWEWGGDSGRYHMDLCSLGMWIILAKIFVNISHHFSRGRRVKASWINMGRSHLPGTRVLGGPDFCITPLL